MTVKDYSAPVEIKAGAGQPVHPDPNRTGLRKVVAALYISLDGVTEAPEKWQFDHFDAEIMAGLESSTAAQDAILLGRLTYQEWAAYWPASSVEPFASYINNIPKYVISTTLDRVDWKNSTLMKGSLATEIARLRRQPGKNIGVAGSPTLVQSLLLQDLLDELTLMILPVVVGAGKRLFNEGSELKRLKLIRSQITTTGVAMLTYQPRQA